MRRSIIVLLASLLLLASRGARGQAAQNGAAREVNPTIETTLATAGGQIRQFAFDGDRSTYFASATIPSGADHFSLLLDKPVAIHSITVLTGRPDGACVLESATLSISADGKRFEQLAQLAGAEARCEVHGRRARMIRISPAEDRKLPMVIREVTIRSDPPVPKFAYPVEFVVGVVDAPDLKKWALQAARVCEQAYPMINEELKSEGFKPPQVVTLSLKNSYKGVAATSGDRITGSVRYFKAHPGDVGAIVHETVHVVQHYHGGENPSWLVEGVSDYVRFFRFEPGRLGRIDRERAHYNGSYRVTAAFLAYLAEKYDKQIVLKLNRVMRQGTYKEGIFEQLTGKKLSELDDEWRATLRRFAR